MLLNTVKTLGNKGKQIIQWKRRRKSDFFLLVWPYKETRIKVIESDYKKLRYSITLIAWKYLKDFFFLINFCNECLKLVAGTQFHGSLLTFPHIFPSNKLSFFFCHWIMHDQTATTHGGKRLPFETWNAFPFNIYMAISTCFWAKAVFLHWQVWWWQIDYNFWLPSTFSVCWPPIPVALWHP